MSTDAISLRRSLAGGRLQRGRLRAIGVVGYSWGLWAYEHFHQRRRSYSYVEWRNPRTRRPRCTPPHSAGFATHPAISERGILDA